MSHGQPMPLTRRWSTAPPIGSVVSHPAVLRLVAQGDPGTRPVRKHIGGMVIVTYSSTRVYMKRDAWEMLPADGVLVQWIRPAGESPWAIALTRRELERAFGEVEESESWDTVRGYHFPIEPPAAKAFRVREPGPTRR